MKLLVLGREPGSLHDLQADPQRHSREALRALLGTDVQTSLHALVARPEGLAARPDDPVPGELPFDWALEVHGEGPAPVAAASRVGEWALQTWRAHAVQGFVLQEHEEFHRRQGVPHTLKLLALLSFHADLGPDAARRSWAHHAVLASRVHLGAQRYRRNWVCESWNSDDERLSVDGMAEIDFAADEDLTERYFDSERGRQEILHDVGHFVRHATRLYLRPAALNAD
jgi:hypothetical protein